MKKVQGPTSSSHVLTKEHEKDAGRRGRTTRAGIQITEKVSRQKTGKEKLRSLAKRVQLFL